MSTRREKIEALRRLAAGTPYQAEKDSALTKADQLEALERVFGDDGTDEDFGEGTDGFPTFDEAMATWMNRWLETTAIAAAVEALGAVAWDEKHWVIPGHPPLLDKDALMRLYADSGAGHS